jgi:hypothetical protein
MEPLSIKNENDNIKNTYVMSNCHFESNAMSFITETDYGVIENSYLNCTPTTSYSNTNNWEFKISFKSVMSIYNVTIYSRIHRSLYFSLQRLN